MQLAKNVKRALSTSASRASLLREKVVSMIPAKQAEIKEINTKYGEKSLGNVTVSQAVGGARDVKCMYWDCSLLDAQEGIRFRGYTIPELQAKLPTAIPGGEPLPEGLLWLLLTGEIPTQQQVADVTADLHARSKLPAHVETMIKHFPKGMHPMTQLSSAVLAMQPSSKFAKAYQSGVNKSKYWESTYEDVLDLIARLPTVAALIYRHSFKSHENLPALHYDSSLDYSANFTRMMGFQSERMDEAMRMYLTIHADHEGGNVSAHTTRLVGSALSDPYLSFSAAMCGLAGPLHGLANQEVLSWVMALQAEFVKAGKPINHETITQYAWDTLNAGKVIPGYGHAVLRKTDPRYMAQREFCQKHMPNDELFKIVSTIYEVVPGVLTKHGKTKNPYPNVDAHSGVLLMHYGLTQNNYYTVLFGVSRAIGVLSQLFWDRALGLAIERPKSVTSEWIKSYCEGSISE